ncbi:MAG: methylated-DNA--[protein]-cysteine S-methyltransferase [Micrococcales bacterium]
MNLNIIYDANAHIESPVGVINLFARDDKLVGLTMGGEAHPALGSAKVLDKAAKQLSEYFAGKRESFELDYELSGTEFQKAVWNQIEGIAFGEVASYADIAQAIGKPLASRAVGGAVGANPLPLVVPCHRVLGASGRITGYSGGDGVPTKRQLLKLENIPTKD